MTRSVTVRVLDVDFGETDPVPGSVSSCFRDIPVGNFGLFHSYAQTYPQDCPLDDHMAGLGCCVQ